MKQAQAIFAIIAEVMLVSGVPALAVEPDEVLENPALEARAREISKELRCVVCQNQTIDDSNARRKEPDPRKPNLDYILYRSGKAATLRVGKEDDDPKAGEDTSFQYGSKPKSLSDHPAIYAIFEVGPVP